MINSSIGLGFSGCHRYEAHQKLGLPTIRCKIRKGTKETLRYVCVSLKNENFGLETLDLLYIEGSLVSHRHHLR